MKRLLLHMFMFVPIMAFTQSYSDYLGAGHSNGITVTSSNQQNRSNWNESAKAENTINGTGLDARLLETSRFLAQATFGCDLNYIKSVAEQPYEDWIDAQFDLNSPSMGVLTQSIYNQARDMFVANGGNADDYFGPFWAHFQYAWWQLNIGNQDLLRQRIALALSEILVISWDSNIGDYGVGLGDYYDILKDHAFGNYKNILLDVALHPMMGGYLSHYNNPKSFPEQNIHPDENFAREIMQLFTIGLYELNQDGSYVLDGNGQRIPTYDNDDIKEFAKVFTGLGTSEVNENPYGITPRFGVDIYWCKRDVPMTMYDEWHEPGEKKLLNGYVIPSGQSGMKDIEDAVNHLFNHQNVGPFIARRLIQQLVKSNPSPAYISRVSAAFNNTKGIRGDMRAVIKAILLDEEARSCSWINNPRNGKLVEPMIRYFNVTRQLDLDNKSGLNWNVGFNFFNATGQAPLGSSSVFNFYLPDYVPNSDFDAANLKGPEFEIHNSVTSLSFVNEVDYWTYPQWYSVLNTWDLELEGTTLNFESLKYYAKESEVLINQLDKLFTHGLLSEETKRLIVDAVDPIAASNFGEDYLDFRVKMAIYLLLVSPDYAILK
ncbi:DUF1800 domain-containing protein [Sabulilitoribacter multivorans]|uniref:DUF1800 domain-containing protein n=1 Tax=Flaviramulus multivorans TaxID=1304750 RepID=A0ABS9IJY7_9FLAO|nr:DUF1800 family protein [Flaviramulus multivorans]MCF7560916.1 DUF1800 domain-containing protein [Flaviramulus multivorans]